MANLILGFWVMITLSISSLRAAIPDVQGDVKANPSVWLGTWYRQGSTQFEDAQINIDKISESRFHFSMWALDGAQNGEVDGFAVLRGNKLIWNSSEVKARVLFSFVNGRLDVTASGETNYYAGYGVSFKGVYARHKPTPAEYPLTDVEVFDNHTEEREFKKLVGKYYELFVSSMQLVDREPCLALKSYVSVGFVRGEASDEAAIIEINASSGTMSAAVMEEDSPTVIQYFSNDRRMKDCVPSLIQEWIKEHSFSKNAKIEKHLSNGF